MEDRQALELLGADRGAGIRLARLSTVRRRRFAGPRVQTERVVASGTTGTSSAGEEPFGSARGGRVGGNGFTTCRISTRCAVRAGGNGIAW